MRVILIGLGKAGWSSDVANDVIFKSHTKSIGATVDFELVAGVDTSFSARLNWQSNTGLPAYKNFDDAIRLHDCDLVVIATSINSLYPNLIEVFEMSSSVRVIIEKPVISNESQFESLKDFSDKFSNRVVVNLPRLFSSEVDFLKSYIADRKILDIAGNYSGGHLNTSLHLISLVNYLTKDVVWVSHKKDSVHGFTLKKHGELLGKIYETTETNESTFDLILNSKDFCLRYLQGGTKIELDVGRRLIEVVNTRETYQKNVYDFILSMGFDAAVARAGLKVMLPSFRSLHGIN